MDGKRISLPLTDEVIDTLRVGDRVLLSGEMTVARDAAHKRIYEAILSGEEPPVDLKGAVIYYMGPSPAREGRPIGSAGPTTSGRMDKYTPTFLSLGVKATVGKGARSAEVTEAIAKNHAVYFAAVGGCGALLSKCITSSRVICYPDLGAEAVLRITVEDFPVIVAVDCTGSSIY